MQQKKHILKMRLCVLIAFLFPVYSFSQDLAGVWTGKIYNDTTHQYIPFQLAINESNGKASGFSHTTFIFDSLTNIGVKSVKIKVKNNQVIIEDEKFIYNDFAEPPPKGVKMFAFLTLSKSDKKDVLSGIWKTNATKMYRPLTGTVFLEKKRKDPEETAIVKKLVDLGYGNQLLFLPPSQNVSSTKNEDLARAQKAREDSIKKARTTRGNRKSAKGPGRLYQETAGIRSTCQGSKSTRRFYKEGSTTRGNCQGAKGPGRLHQETAGIRSTCQGSKSPRRFYKEGSTTRGNCQGAKGPGRLYQETAGIRSACQGSKSTRRFYKKARTTCGNRESAKSQGRFDKTTAGKTATRTASERGVGETKNATGRIS